MSAAFPMTLFFLSAWNGPTIVLALLILLLFAAVVVHLVRGRKKGVCSCGGGCSGCAGACHCHPSTKTEHK